MARTRREIINQFRQRLTSPAARISSRVIIPSLFRSIKLNNVLQALGERPAVGAEAALAEYTICLCECGCAGGITVAPDVYNDGDASRGRKAEALIGIVERSGIGCETRAGCVAEPVFIERVNDVAETAVETTLLAKTSGDASRGFEDAFAFAFAVQYFTFSPLGDWGGDASLGRASPAAGRTTGETLLLPIFCTSSPRELSPLAEAKIPETEGSSLCLSDRLGLDALEVFGLCVVLEQ